MSSSGPIVKILPLGSEVGERVLLLVDLRRRHAAQQRPGVGRRVVDLGSVGPRLRVGRVAADRDVAAVGELGERRVPARAVHVRDALPRRRRRIEDRRVGEAEVAGREDAVAAGGEDPAVGQVHVAGAEDAARGVDGRRERLRGRVPDRGRLRLLPAVPDEQVAVLEQHGVHARRSASSCSADHWPRRRPPASPRSRRPTAGWCRRRWSPRP